MKGGCQKRGVPVANGEDRRRPRLMHGILVTPQRALPQ